VLPASSDGETVVLTPPGEPTATPPSSKRNRPPMRIVLAIAAVLAALTVGGFAWNALSSGGTSESTPPAPLPENGGALGIHLEQLMESVTP